MTIDIDVQNAIEAIFAQKELSGAVVINEVQTGRMLALVSAPERDLNLRDSTGSEEYNAMLEDPLDPLANKLTWRYSLGGLYNLIVGFAALDSGIISTTKEIYCSGYQWYNQKVYRCTKHSGHEKVNLKKALAEDCRIYFYELAQQLGPQKMARYTAKLGFGRKTGIDLSYEQSGRIITGVGEKVYSGEGQKWEEEYLAAILGKKFNLATSIQVSMFTATIANGGVFYKPAVVEEMQDASGEVLEQFTPEVLGYAEGKTSLFKNLYWAMPRNQFVVGTSETGEKLKLTYSGLLTSSEPLRKNITEGSFSNSSEKQGGQHAWFTGFTPIMDPQIAVTVLLDNTSGDIGEAEKIAQEVIIEYYRFSQ